MAVDYEVLTPADDIVETDLLALALKGSDSVYDAVTETISNHAEQAKIELEVFPPLKGNSVWAKWDLASGIPYTGGIDTSSSTLEVVKPTQICDKNSYDCTVRIFKSEYGGKAQSLQILMTMSLNVPQAWVVPCHYTNTRPTLNLHELPTYYRYAVRSGAAESMPGMMDTELNVRWEDLPEAANRVWDSWNSERAVAYRNEHDISHDSGTAVIFQRMVSRLAVAWVGYTNLPSAGDDPNDFNPLIEYVKGVGESLVSGESSGFVADGSEKWCPDLVKALKRIHDAWGPSDVEGCVDEDGTIWFVQQRALKFSAKVVQTVQAEEFGDRKIINTLKPIGAPVTVSGTVVTEDWTGDLSDKIIYVESFNPEYYVKMMKSKAIITCHGGETCHAAIIARELGRAALSGSLPMGQLFTRDDNDNFIGRGIVVNGSTGVIYEALPEDLAPTGEAVAVAEEVQPVLRPNLGVQNVSWNANKLLYRFYKALNDYNNSLITKDRKDEVVREIAHIMSSHHYIISVGEMRHLKNQCIEYKQCAAEDKLIHQLGERGVPIPTSGRETPNRDKFLEDGGIPQPENLQRAIEVIDLVLKGFTEFRWSSSFGGSKWGTIADLVSKYLKGQLSDTLFVDICFNLQHNNGRAFNKFHWMTSQPQEMENMLDAKKKSFDHLHRVTKYSIYTTHADFLSFSEKETLLPAKYKLGPDEPVELLDTPVEWEDTCECGSCGCEVCYEDGYCGNDECDECRPCECGDCGCERCFEDGLCHDYECNECHPCDCGECGCERCYSDGRCDSDNCNDCNPCDCKDCGCERCFPDNDDNKCEDDDCKTCNPCECGDIFCKECHLPTCTCPRCKVVLEQTTLDLTKPEEPDVGDKCNCAMCKQVENELVTA